MAEQMEMLTETPEEKSFFDNKGGPAPAAPAPEPVVAEPVATPTASEPVAAPAAPAAEPPHKTMIPLATLLEERRTMQAKYEALAAKVNPPAPPAAPVDPEQDPITVIKDLVNFKAETEKQQEQQRELAVISNFGSQHADAFRKEKPDFDAAYQHLRVSRANQLIESGEVQTPQELNARIQVEEKEIITMCARMRIDPARFMYSLAGAVGYAAQQAAAAAVDANAAQQAAPAQSAPVTPAAPATPSAADKLKMAAEGQDRATSSGKVPASGKGGPLDLRIVNQLSDEEFDKATSGNNWKGMWN